jgi:chemotaxis protein methyltransferase CheR
LTLPASAPRRKRSGLPPAPATVPRDPSGLSVSPALFGQFQQLIHQETGIWLGDTKSALLCGRLSRRLRVLKMSSLAEYYDLITLPDQHDERVLMIDAITTNETRFFRDPRHFEFLEGRVIPRWRTEAQQGLRMKSIRVWSAGCSSGEEPYSLAMLLARHLPAEQGWSVAIFASDISTKILAQARAGIYNITKSPDIPEPLLKDYMLKGVDHQQGQMKVTPEIQATVDFQKLNLAYGPYPPQAHFDAIFCRNVLIYFDLQSKQKVVEHLAHCLARNGLLFVGQAENLSNMNSKLKSLAPAVYARAGEHVGF